MSTATRLAVEIELDLDGITATDEAVERLTACIEFLHSIPDMQKRHELFDTLWRCFESLKRLGRNDEGGARLGTDFAPLSFGWRACGMVGGMIYHGPHDNGGDGGAPTYSVSLDDCRGWQLHS